MNQRLIVTGLVCALAGCLDSSEPTPEPAEPAMVERTIVKLLPDGSEQVTVQQVTAAQQRQELAERERRAHLAPASASGGTGEVVQGLASTDSGCAASSMWMFDSDNNQLGTGLFSHEICFFKSSTAFPICADLRQYARLCFFGGGCQNWAGDTGNWIGSYWAGQDTGMFLEASGAVEQGFSPYFRQDNAQLTVPRATYLCFPN
jgi:hypothetical protein